MGSHAMPGPTTKSQGEIITRKDYRLANPPSEDRALKAGTSAMPGERIPKQKAPLEAAIVKKILVHLNTRYSDGWWVKIHGDPFQRGGLPDIIGCWRGRFVGLEVKRDHKQEPTARQWKTLSVIHDHGGIAGVVTSVEEVDECLNGGMASFGMRGATDSITATARYGPKEAQHPSVNLLCPACNFRFKPGDYTTLIPLGPGPYPEEQDKARHGRTYHGVMIEVHWRCATGDADPGAEDDDD